MDKQHNITESTSVNFGGAGGNFTPLTGQTGSAQIQFYGGSFIDAIQIGAHKYGGGGGDLQGSATLPANGIFTLTRLEAKPHTFDGDIHTIVTYLECIIDGRTCKVGESDKDAVFLDGSLDVKFAGITSGTYVDAIKFEVVSTATRK